MPERLELIKQEIQDLIFFTLKLFLHWLVLAAILAFVLFAAWVHQFFKEIYFQMETHSSDSANARVMQPRQLDKKNGVERLRQRKTKQKRGSGKKI